MGPTLMTFTKLTARAILTIPIPPTLLTRPTTSTLCTDPQLTPTRTSFHQSTSVPTPPPMTNSTESTDTCPSTAKQQSKTPPTGVMLTKETMVTSNSSVFVVTTSTLSVL